MQKYSSKPHNIYRVSLPLNIWKKGLIPTSKEAYMLRKFFEEFSFIGKINLIMKKATGP
jgi:hypothetical protein